MKANIHSIETFGTVDGPGIRFVVFFQGCPMRCQFCHNPDTWQTKGGTSMSVDEIWSQLERNRVFYTNGGITATGGEPLLQLPFLIELFQKAREEGVHTCLDTSGICYDKLQNETYQKLFDVTNLIMLDIKCADPVLHQELTGNSLLPILSFADATSAAKVPLRIRHVVVPGKNDKPEQLEALGRLLARFDNLVELEVLPYHTMGIVKYENLGIPYPLKGVPALSKEEAAIARKIILNARKQERISKKTV